VNITVGKVLIGSVCFRTEAVGKLLYQEKEHPHSMIGGEFFDCVCSKIHWRIRDIYHHHSKSKRGVKIVFVYSKKV